MIIDKENRIKKIEKEIEALDIEILKLRKLQNEKIKFREKLEEDLQLEIIEKRAWKIGPWPSREAEILTVEDFNSQNFYCDDGDFELWFARVKDPRAKRDRDKYEICINVNLGHSPWPPLDKNFYANVLSDFPLLCYLDHPEDK